MTESHLGGCQCGAVRYRLEGPLARAYACHCRDCQKQSASAFSLSIPIELPRLHLIGALFQFEKHADSGAVTTCHACGACGSRIYHASSRAPERGTLKVGSLDDPSGIRPAAHLWVSRKQQWVLLNPDVPAFETQPSDLAAWRRSLLAD